MDLDEYFQILEGTRDLMWRESLLGELRTYHPGNRWLTPMGAVALRKLGSTTRVSLKDAGLLNMDLGIAKLLINAGFGSMNDFRVRTVEAVCPAPMFVSAQEETTLVSWALIFRGFHGD